VPREIFGGQRRLRQNLREAFGQGAKNCPGEKVQWCNYEWGILLEKKKAGPAEPMYIVESPFQGVRLLTRREKKQKKIPTKTDGNP